MAKAINIHGIEAATGVPWNDWVTRLEPYRDLNHTELAKVVLEQLVTEGVTESPEWWAQGVTIAFEQHIGRRVPGQQSDGLFTVAVSRTVTGIKEAALENWAEYVATLSDINGFVLVSEPKISHTDKWSYWRANLSDGSRLSVNVQTKPQVGKSSVTVNHDKIAEQAAIEGWRAFWKTTLANL